MKVCIVGGGAWGTALAQVVASKHEYDVVLWAREDEVCEVIVERRENDVFLKGVELEESLGVEKDLVRAVSGADVVVMAVPAQFSRSVMEAIGDAMPGGAVIVNVAKGIEVESRMRISEIIFENFPGREYAILAGPNIAVEVAQGEPANAVVACGDGGVREMLVDLFMTDRFQVVGGTDVVGVELCGVLKNVYAIGAGVIDGLGFSDNAKAGYLTKALWEMERIVEELGGSAESVRGFAGVGDLMVTSLSRHGRNRTFGEWVGRGLSVDEAVDKMGGKVVEGVWNARVVAGLVDDLNDFSLSKSVQGLVNGKFSAAEFFSDI